MTRVKHDLSNPPCCPYCLQRARLVHADVIYPGRDFSGLYWHCQRCQAWVGTHKNSKRAVPLGSLANAELRRARQAVHARLDPLWNAGKVLGHMTRQQAYELLGERMGIHNPHVGFFSVDDCAKAHRAIDSIKFGDGGVIVGTNRTTSGAIGQP
jgi:hypothetical protein